MIPIDLLIALIITVAGGLYIISPINLLPFNPIDEVGVGIVLVIMWAVIGITRFQMLISTLAFPDVTIWDRVRYSWYGNSWRVIRVLSEGD